MIIDFDPDHGNGEPTLLDAENFQTLKLVLHTAPQTDGEMPGAVGRLGDWVGSHMFVQPDVIRSLAGRHAENLRWQKQFDVMMAYAMSSGWVDDRGAVRIHIDYQV